MTISYRQRNRLLLPAFLLVIWLCYAFAIRNTIWLRAKCSQLTKQTDSAKVSNNALVSLRAQQLQFASLTADSSRGLHEALLGTVTGYCKSNHTILRSFAPALQYQCGAWKVETHEITVEGNYAELLRLVYVLEHEQVHGKIVSADFHAVRDLRTQTTALQLTLYIQNILKS